MQPPDDEDPMTTFDRDLRLTLRPLDPSRDEVAWERAIQAVVRRATARRATLTRTLVRDGRLALALAAAAALAAWTVRAPASRAAAPAGAPPAAVTGATDSAWSRLLAGETPDALELLSGGGAP